MTPDGGIAIHPTSPCSTYCTNAHLYKLQKTNDYRIRLETILYNYERVELFLSVLTSIKVFVLQRMYINMPMYYI